MCRTAILLPIPRDPEWRNSHTVPVSSAVTSMKWLPEPRVPSWSRQFGAYEDGSNPASSARRSSSAIRAAAVAVSSRL